MCTCFWFLNKVSSNHYVNTELNSVHILIDGLCCICHHFFSLERENHWLASYYKEKQL